MLTKRMFGGLALCAAAAWLSGCGRKPESPPTGAGEGAAPAQTEEAPKPLRIAVIPKGTTHEFWKSVHAGALKAQRELPGVTIIWKGPLKEDDREAQITVVEDFITQQVDGIVVAPLDDKALVKPVKEAVKAGIPVVIFDSALAAADYVSFVATDNYKGGCIAAERLGQLLGGKGNVIMLRYQEGSASTTKREQGFLDTLAKKFPGIKVVSSNQYAGATTESAQKAAENLLNRFPKLDGVYCPNESSTFGMLLALQESGRAGKVKFVGFDSSKKLVDALRAGQLHGLVLQNPINMGYLAVKTIVEHIRGQKVPRRIDTGAVLVTKENMDEPAMKQLHSPDLKKLLGE